MPEQTISSLKKLKEKAIVPKKPESRANALKHYFSKGGIIRVNLDSYNSEKWPSLVYPTKLRLRELIKKKRELRDDYLKKREEWNKTLRNAKFYNITHSVKKFSSPLYWKHLAKMVQDPDYREDAKKVNLPLHLVSDSRWKPMIKMFIEDLEYRKQLTETVEHSIVYKKNKKLAKYANELQNFRKDASTKKITELQKKINSVNADINSYRELIKWANER